METEQMAAVAAGRGGYVQGRPPRASGRLQVENRAQATYEGHPIPVMVLSEFVEAIPANAMVSIEQITGGEQMDPYPTGYRLSATW